MGTDTVLGEGVFAIPHEGRFLIYAPLAGRVALVNEACLAALRSFVATGNEEVVSNALKEELGGLAWLHPPRIPVPLPYDRIYCPTGVTLFLTNRCNLRCEYCYARAGEFQAVDLPDTIARAAIDFALYNARRAGRPAFVGFHGGGEQTCNWTALTHALGYARQQAEKAGVSVHFSLATNGVMSDSQAEYIANNFMSISLSFDGPPEVHDMQRPMASGEGTHAQVLRFIATLKEHKTGYGIRATITSRTVGRMPELVDYFVEETGCTMLHFEPAFGCGRCAGAETTPSISEYAQGFVQALARAEKRGVQLKYSAAVPNMRHSFCGCSEDAFTITPDGHITACYEVCDEYHPMADKFHFGWYDHGQGQFVIDYEKLAQLRSLHINNREDCRHCFARWQCAGDCPLKNAMQCNDTQGRSARCQTNRRINLELIYNALANGQAQQARNDMEKEFSHV